MGYDGTAFSGWAIQVGRRTVQGELETWLGRVIGSEPPRLVCAGRTDAGVHARGQVAHLDLDPASIPDAAAAVRRLNRVLPVDLVVWRLTPAPVGFDARFSAVWRRYVYRLAEPSSPVHPLYRNQVTRLHRDLNLEQMNAAAGALVGLRDFGAFCRGREGGTAIRTLLDLRVMRVTAGPLQDVIECTVRADAFCHSMVRSLVGALVEVGSGRRDAGWLETVAAAAVRDPAIPVLAPGGLTLEEVGYPADAELAERARQARTLRSVADA
ncbi:MAG TPA: tRNA pseudouridine(38-40) synthase TruA [Propionibacteriaceae bacterium]|nr:tRNA pseudouridine(38-40) synthase TruA [Propionibacteriaceae bacterium]